MCVFWKVILVFVSLMMYVDFFLSLDVRVFWGWSSSFSKGDMYPMFLHWLPKYCLSMPSKRSLQVWRMVIDNLTVDNVSFSFSFLFVRGVLCLIVVWLSFILGSL